MQARFELWKPKFQINEKVTFRYGPQRGCLGVIAEDRGVQESPDGNAHDRFYMVRFTNGRLAGQTFGWFEEDLLPVSADTSQGPGP